MTEKNKELIQRMRSIAQASMGPDAVRVPPGIQALIDGADALELAITTPSASAQEAEPVALDRYDAGYLNDFGGGDVNWWQDYLRAELERAHDFYQSQMEAAPSAIQRCVTCGGAKVDADPLHTGACDCSAPSASPAALTLLGPDEDGLPIQRFSHRSTGMVDHPNGTYVRYGEVERRIRLAASPADQVGDARDEPDMFWDDADPERCEDSINNVVVRAYESHANVGDVIEVQRAIRLSNISVRIIPDPDDSEEITYEIVEDAAMSASKEGA